MAKTQKKNGGNRKIGRSRNKCEQYSREHRREKNKIIKIAKHLKVHSFDVQSRQVMQKLSSQFKGVSV